MNILVTGANGQLGRELRRASKGSSHRFIFSDVTELPGEETVYLDITNKDALSLIAQSEQIDLFINCAAYTAVNRAEADVQMAELLNHYAAENLAMVAKESGTELIHISTDYIFCGTKRSTPYKECDLAEPCNVYGSTKLAGERRITRSGCKYIIIRTAWLYSTFGRNFVKTMLEMLSGSKDVKVVCDAVGSPTYARDLAYVIMHIIEKGMLDETGIYHYTDEGVARWYDFAQAIKEYSGKPAKVVAINNEDFPNAARRPSYSVLDKTLIKETCSIEIPYWRDSLKKCLEEYETDKQQV